MEDQAECPIVVYYGLRWGKTTLYEAAMDRFLTEYASKHDKSIHQAAAELAQSSYPLSTRKYYASIATKVKY